MRWILVPLGALAGLGLGAWSLHWGTEAAAGGAGAGAGGAPTNPEATAATAAPDPLAKVIASLRDRMDLDGFAELGEPLSRLTAEQMAKLIEWMERQSHEGSDYRMGWMAMWWLKRDPRAAAAWIEKRLRRDAENPLISTLFTPRWPMTEAWTQAFPKEALAFAREYPNASVAGSILFTALGGRKARAPGEGWDLIRDFPEGPGRVREATRLIRDWAGKDALAALAAAEGLAPGKTREAAMSEALPSVAAKDPDLAFAKYQELGVPDADVLAKILANAATQDPEGAAEWLLKFDPAQIRKTAPQLVAKWAAKDPAAALAWAQEHDAWSYPSSVDTTTYFHDGFGHASGSSSGSAAAVNIFAAAMKADAKATMAWVTALPPGPDREQAVLGALYEAKADDALALFAQLPPGQQESTVGAVLQKMDAKAAAQWAGSLPQGKMRENAWRTLGGSERPENTPPPAGVDRDAWLTGSMYRGRAFDQDPERALGVLLEIQDPQKQRAAFDRVMISYEADYMKQQRKTALEWMEKAKLPEAWKGKWRGK